MDGNDYQESDMTWEEMQRARWVPNSPTAWILKFPIKDGGEVVAFITREKNAYVWSTIRHTFDWHPTLRGAMRDARWAYWLSLPRQHVPSGVLN